MMIVENVETCGWEPALRGMRNPLDSWERADSRFGGKVYVDEIPGLGEYVEHADYPVSLGPNDESLMRRLIGQGSSDHCKFRRMLVIYCDVTAPLYWWKEFDTYKVGTVANSCSTMHTLMNRTFRAEMFSCEDWQYLDADGGKRLYAHFEGIINDLNTFRGVYLDGKRRGDKEKMEEVWRKIIQLLPESWNQRRTLMLNYEVMANIYRARKNHKLEEWHDFIDAIVEAVPHPWIFTGEGC